ncbi:MAG: sigma-70 family RNA polymerase sigma factor [Nibricoccus sp.]
MDDASLLRSYIDERSEAAFTELVKRHVDLVYHAALRQMGGDTHAAEEVAQNVFTSLVRKASLLKHHTALTGWLYTATQLAAREHRRAESRRRVREQRAYAMKEAEPPANDTEWNRLRPVIDDAFGELKPRDREAILLRFFENRTYAQVGEALRLSENATRMCVERALEKLHGALSKRGVVSTAAALAGALAIPATHAAPAALAQQVSGAALAAGVATGSGVSVFTLLELMTKTKIFVAATTVAAVVALSVAVQQHRQHETERAKLAESSRREAELVEKVAHLEKELAQTRTDRVHADEPAEKLTSNSAQTLRAPEAITREMVDARLKHARKLAEEGRHEEALREFLWCYDIGTRQVSGYFITRHTAVLDGIVALGKSYPQALEALRLRRDAAETKLKEGANDLDLGKEFGQINRVLGENQRTRALFDSLETGDPRRNHIIDTLRAPLLKERRYVDLAKAMPYSETKSAWEHMVQSAHAVDVDEAVRQARRQGFVGWAAGQIEIMAGAGDTLDASDFIERLLVFNGTPETVALIEKHLQRAANPDLLKVP